MTRISEQEALDLFLNAPLDELCARANAEKESRHGKSVYWVNNRQINYTNVCVLHCKFCAFSRIKKDSPTAYDWNYETIRDKAAEAIGKGARELHIVGGLHPDHPFDYYIEMLRKLRKEFPSANLKAFTAVEICHFAKISGQSPEQIMATLKDAGLDALPGGGAEILVQSVRDKICPGKETGEEWLAVHRAAHKLGIPTNATMLFGHIEKIEDRIAHMKMLRDLQDEAPGFFAFIPLVYHPEHNALHQIARQLPAHQSLLDSNGNRNRDESPPRRSIGFGRHDHRRKDYTCRRRHSPRRHEPRTHEEPHYSRKSRSGGTRRVIRKILLAVRRTPSAPFET